MVFTDEELASVDPASEVESQVLQAELPDLRGASVAVLVGSRGIACIVPVVRSLVASLRSRGAEPFIVPAMGSHGGATAVGQRQVLDEYEVNEQSVGAQIRSSMETVELDSTGLETRLFADRNAWGADFVVPVNRVKAHTDFSGSHESGLLKMLAIGMGKQDQALEQHNFGVRGLRDLVVPSATRLLESGKVLFGVAIVENARKKPARIGVIPSEDIVEREASLLSLAKGLSPSLPCDSIALLIVDELGKDKSGTGLDTNVIGRRYLPGEDEPKEPNIEVIVVRRLSAASHGNAVGIGLADIVLRELADSIDYQATYENIITSSFLERGKLPVVAATDADALSIAARALHSSEISAIKAMHIESTLELETIGVSEALFDTVTASGRCRDLGRTYTYPDQ